MHFVLSKQFIAKDVLWRQQKQDYADKEVLVLRCANENKWLGYENHF